MKNAWQKAGMNYGFGFSLVLDMDMLKLCYVKPKRLQFDLQL